MPLISTSVWNTAVPQFSDILIPVQPLANWLNHDSVRCLINHVLFGIARYFWQIRQRVICRFGVFSKDLQRQRRSSRESISCSRMDKLVRLDNVDLLNMRIYPCTVRLFRLHVFSMNEEG